MVCNQIIKIENIHFSYDSDEEDGSVVKKDVLRGISLEIEKGSFVAIVGPNGSGKSTLAKHLNALLLPTEGDVFVDGINTKTDNPIEIRSKVGMVFQNPDNQLVSSIVEDDVAFGPENLGVESKEIRRRVDDALNRVSMYEFRKKGPHLLSGGQKQRVAIAGTLAMGTDCIIFDESTAMLDPSGRKEIMDIIHQLHSEGKTVILITHFMEEAALTDRIIVVHKGQIYADASPKELFTGKLADKLSEISLAPPFAARLANDLRANGIDVPKDIFTEEALADYLCKLK